MEPSLLPDPIILFSRSRNLLNRSSLSRRRLFSILLAYCSPNSLRVAARRSFNVATRDGSAACARRAILSRRSRSEHTRWMKYHAETKPISRRQPYCSKKRHSRLMRVSANIKITLRVLKKEESTSKTPSIVLRITRKNLKCMK